MKSMMSDDAHDLRLARQGGPDGHTAFARLYDRHAPVVLALCRRQFPADPDDAVQQTFIRAYRMLERLDDDDRFRPWVYAISRLVCAEMRRAAGRRSKHERAAIMNRVDVQNGMHRRMGASSMTAPGHQAERDEMLSRLGAALDRLPDRERLAVHLFYLEPDPVAAAASDLGLSRSGFYKLLTRAREHLASFLTEASKP